MDRSKMNDPNYVNALWQAGIIKDKTRNNHIRRIEYNRQQIVKYRQMMINQQREIERLRKEISEKNSTQPVEEQPAQIQTN